METQDQDMDTSEVTRIEVIDHRTSITPNKGATSAVLEPRGRVFVRWDPDIKTEVSLQDNRRTLKVFITDRHEKNH